MWKQILQLLFNKAVLYFFIGIILSFRLIALGFGYPDLTQGMNQIPPLFLKFGWERKLELPARIARPMPDSHPITSIVEVIFAGRFLRPEIPDTIMMLKPNIDDFKSPVGPFGFYIQRYRNTIFLPDQVSEFIQIFFNIHDNTSDLEFVRETIFILLNTYLLLMGIRFMLAWLSIINPYQYPYFVLLLIVDWFEDNLANMSITIAGVSLISVIQQMIVGRMADFLNYIVFTMPYLPSEGLKAKTVQNPPLDEYGFPVVDPKTGRPLIDPGEVKILVFKDLPYLWVKYPIPNDLREKWFFNEKLQKYFKRYYGKYGINFLPDSELNKPIDLSHINFPLEIKYKVLEYNTLCQESFYKFNEKFFHFQSTEIDIDTLFGMGQLFLT